MKTITIYVTIHQIKYSFWCLLCSKENSGNWEADEKDNEKPELHEEFPLPALNVRFFKVNRTFESFRTRVCC
jgi:hypothetical protein